MSLIDFQKYQKTSVVVGAMQAGTDALNLGALGTLSSTDWIIRTSDDALHTMDPATFTTKYELASDTATLTGTDWD